MLKINSKYRYVLGRRFFQSQVVLKRGSDKSVDHASPMVFPGAVDSVTGDDSLGALAVVKSAEGRTLGWGFYNPTSFYRVRLAHILTRDGDIEDPFDCRAALRAIVSRAVETRKAIGLPNEKTNMYRLINWEGDNLSGLAVDIYEKVAVCHVTAAWIEVHRNAVESALQPFCEEVIWLRAPDRLAQDGLEVPHARPPSVSERFLSTTELPTGYMKVIENGITFAVNPHGRKSGHFMDNRENRLALRELIARRGPLGGQDKKQPLKVLDLCCFSGAFGLNAVSGALSVGTPISVKAVDINQKFIDMAQRNANLNPDLNSHIEFIRDDIFEYLQNPPSNDDGQYDIVILDPPRMTKSVADAQVGADQHETLNSMAMKFVKRSGIMMTSCSSMPITHGKQGSKRSDRVFLSLLKEAGRGADRSFRVLRVTGAGDDYVEDLGWPYCDYMTMVWLHMN